MTFPTSAPRRASSTNALRGLGRFFPMAAAVLGVWGCASGGGGGAAAPSLSTMAAASAPRPDPRVGLRAGLFDAADASWNLHLLSTTPPPRAFVGSMNSDLAFKDNYAIQGNYDGVQIWDISNPSRPSLAASYVCPASQSDVSVYGNLLFVSGEGFGGRLDCGTEGVRERVSHERLRGIRIFDISDIRDPQYIANVQTCRGSHTHTVVDDPNDHENVYVYVSGSAPVRPAAELPGCSGAQPEDDPNSALFRIEVIRVPLDNPEDAQVVSSPRIFTGLVAPPTHGLAPAELAVIDSARAAGAFILDIPDAPQVVPDPAARMLLDSLIARRGGTGAPTAADSTALRSYLGQVAQEMVAQQNNQPNRGPSQCHDITVYPAIGLAGGACGGYGLLIDIGDVVNPQRIDAASDANFSYWHSATFNNDGTKLLFSDEWGGGGQPKCRASDPKEWGADAIFTIEDRKMSFHSYYKLSAAQTPLENCVAHNGSLIPVPGRDVMVQAWYQGGISVFDWTNPQAPAEIAFFDRGPVDPDRMMMGGSWSAYWYNGLIVSSEIARGLDVFELTPSPLLTQNEIDAAKSVRLEYMNAQDQPHFVWPATFALAGAYVDQLERSGGLTSSRIREVRGKLADAEGASGTARSEALQSLAAELSGDAARSADARKVRMLAEAVRNLAAAE